MVSGLGRARLVLPGPRRRRLRTKGGKDHVIGIKSIPRLPVSLVRKNMSRREGAPLTPPKSKRQRQSMLVSQTLKRQPAFYGKYPTAKRQKKNNSNVVTLMSYPMPQKCRTQLHFLAYPGLISALTDSHSLVYRPTSYYDVDPAVGGGSYAGYTFFASQYGRYRVTGFRYRVTFINLETTAVAVGCQAIASQATPASGTAADYVEAASENDY